ncbi:helix-turn-helix domain-containing protein [Chryseobacterium nepalense]|uniref:AraC family transcriptional regulator n=1 Tax=Chryseobacterium nepalense TaxID=1854498 RepID=A0ABY4K8F3_9FLAO|nr:AraC family transcriptional regulator [Chryseobacterium nepalense]UPQ77071.1 AraC family transcriptional regulator [Chryseobacterium nepalense]
MSSPLQYHFKKPAEKLADFVYGFSSLSNISECKEGIIIPNGRIDLLLCRTTDGRFFTVLMGLETKPKTMPQQNIAMFFSISFNPLALEYILNESIAELINNGKELPENFWGFREEDLNNFEDFCDKASHAIKKHLSNSIDERKRNLFRLIFEANGEISIKELSQTIHWSERQINRYFTKYLGVTLKMYCKILRFQKSLEYIKDGILFPQLNFSDQSHFIKDVKKLSGVSPKELFKNDNDRFLQFLVFPKK